MKTGDCRPFFFIVDSTLFYTPVKELRLAAVGLKRRYMQQFILCFISPVSFLLPVKDASGQYSDQ